MGSAKRHIAVFDITKCCLCVEYGDGYTENDQLLHGQPMFCHVGVRCRDRILRLLESERRREQCCVRKEKVWRTHVCVLACWANSPRKNGEPSRRWSHVPLHGLRHFWTFSLSSSVRVSTRVIEKHDDDSCRRV